MTSIPQLAFSGSSSSPSPLPAALASSSTVSSSSAIFSGEIAPRDQATADVVSRLRRLEETIGDAYAQAGELASALITARRLHGRSPIVGHKVLEMVGQAQLSAAQAAGHAAGAHRMLDQLAIAIGIDVSAYGDAGKGPETFTSAALASADRI